MSDSKTQKPEIEDAEELNDALDVPVIAVPTAEEKEPPLTLSEPMFEPADAPEAAPETDEAPDEPVAKAETAPPSRAVEPAPAASGGGFLPMFLGGLVAAAIGAGATLYVLPKLAPAFLEKLSLQPASTVDVTALTEALAAQTARTDALAAELGALKSAPAPAAVADLSGVQAALDESGATVRSVAEAQAALEARLSALEARPAETGVPAEVLDPLRAEIADLRTQLEQRSTGSAVAQEQIEAAVAVAQERILQAEEEAARLRGESEASARRMMVQAAVARLGTALDSGTPVAPAVSELEAAGVSVPDALRAPVVTIARLQATFPAAARTALAAARKEAVGESMTDRLGAFLMAQVGARSLDPREGTDPDAILSRAQAAVDAGDLAAAVAEIGTLSPGAQTALADWTAQAQARLAAFDALASIGLAAK